MKKTESIEKDALTEMMSPSVSPSAARNAEVKKSVEMASLDFTPKNRIAGSVIDEEAVAEPQSIMEVSTITEEPPPPPFNAEKAASNASSHWKSIVTLT